MNKIIVSVVVLVIVGVGTYYLVFKEGSPDTSPTYSPAQTSQANSPTPLSTVMSSPQLTSTPAMRTPSPSPTPTATAKVSTSPATSISASIDIANFAFSPPTMTVKTGTKINWTNKDSAAHSVKSDAGNLLDSTNLSQNQSYSFTFTSVGTFNYHCGIHPTMKGTIIVTN